MTGLHEALDDIAAEITPIHPPVERAMRLGHKKRHRRRIAAITGTAGALALSAAAVIGIPALTGPAATPALTPGAARGAGIPLARPVLFESPQGSAKDYGDAHLVNSATLRLFQRLTCTPARSGLSGAVTSDAWKATVGYTAAQWNAAGSEVVSCDASGGKYVLGKAVIRDSQVTSATARHMQNGQWAVDVTLNSAATTAFAQLTTSQATRYYPASRSNSNDAVLASTAFVINGNVQSAPVTGTPITIGKLMITGAAPAGLTEVQAQALAVQLS
jgi:preprotein translocase subunit SecD